MGPDNAPQASRRRAAQGAAESLLPGLSLLSVLDRLSSTPYPLAMSTLNEVGERDAWRCWLCDEPVDPDAYVNSGRGPSVDSGASPKGKKAVAGTERLAHRTCNTRKGAIKPIVAWSPELFVIEPAPIVSTVDRLTRKGGREVVARCPSQADAEKAGGWLLDRLSRFAPNLAVTTQVEAGGGQFLLVLQAV
jgi:hypothetical protein